MLSRALILGVFLIAAFSCVTSPTNVEQAASSTPTPGPYEFDREKAGAISESMVNALVKNDRAALFSKMEKAAREYYDQAAFDDAIAKMVGLFTLGGEVQESRAGQKVGNGRIR
jgi:hypothetical protein